MQMITTNCSYSKFEKKGSILIFSIYLGILIIILLISFLIILYIQLNTQILVLKEDIYYIVQDVISNKYFYDFSYFEFNIDNERIKNDINDVLNERNVTAKILNIVYDKKENVFLLDMKMLIKPIVFEDYIKEYKYNIKEKIKFKIME